MRNSFAPTALSIISHYITTVADSYGALAVPTANAVSLIHHPPQHIATETCPALLPTINFGNIRPAALRVQASRVSGGENPGHCKSRVSGSQLW